jgi:hypothetical protein
LDYLLDRRPTSPGDWVKRNDYLVCGQNYRLADLYTWIGRLAPNAKINVIGYPSLFTDCNQPLLNVLDVAPQSIVDPRIDCQDMTWLAEVGVRVKRVIQTETQVATLSMIAQHLGNRINFIDTQLSDMSELNRDVSNAPSLFVTPANTTSFNPVVFKPLWDAYNGWSVFGQRPESFHPNQNGQNQLAAYIIPHLLS